MLYQQTSEDLHKQIYGNYFVCKLNILDKIRKKIFFFMFIFTGLHIMVLGSGVGANIHSIKEGDHNL